MKDEGVAAWAESSKPGGRAFILPPSSFILSSQRSHEGDEV
jgi:hypothetical protein